MQRRPLVFVIEQESSRRFYSERGPQHPRLDFYGPPYALSVTDTAHPSLYPQLLCPSVYALYLIVYFHTKR